MKTKERKSFIMRLDRNLYDLLYNDAFKKRRTVTAQLIYILEKHYKINRTIDGK